MMLRSPLNSKGPLGTLSHITRERERRIQGEINEIPKLTSRCTGFIESAEQILEKRKVNQIMYCAMGLGWVRLDFRGLFPSHFEEENMLQILV
ncbi:hypothetical protein VNO77_02256 [Canavalia gladiata]|uniref:Conserved oligomeric Golgi complex subunit 8 n=1 Tax=Canavalia gladiata TaxID=3824 RepID=A0AAN9RB39_CANGL